MRAFVASHFCPRRGRNIIDRERGRAHVPIDRADSSILDLSEKLRFPKICERWMRMKRRLIFFFLPSPPSNRLASLERTHARTPFIVCIVHEIIIQGQVSIILVRRWDFFPKKSIVLSFSSHGTRSNKFVRFCRKFPSVFSSFSGKKSIFGK